MSNLPRPLTPMDLGRPCASCAAGKKRCSLTKNPSRPCELCYKRGDECLPGPTASLGHSPKRKRQRIALASGALPGTPTPLASLPPDLTPGGGGQHRIESAPRAPLGPEMPSSLPPPILTPGVNGQHRIESATRALPSHGMLSPPPPPIPTLGVDGQHRTDSAPRALSGLEMPSPIPSVPTSGGDGQHKVDSAPGARAPSRSPFQGARGSPSPASPLPMVPHPGSIVGDSELPVWTSPYASYLGPDGFFRSLAETKWVWTKIPGKDLALSRFHPGPGEIEFTWDESPELGPSFVSNEVGPDKTTLIVRGGDGSDFYPKGEQLPTQC
ncbi:hypothetical protein B0T14DRAFT_5675 [Immersiella caudata]|uniref:Zn(2)-C6 fungal-type domain-containing protein n=1 Tax=Immersiella caudata TaxID=314043 RepID=A0AA39XCX0_9PEZI|nr:hypothetical protein B0T14DRAFT_5675 [Immersiella caudata]